MAGRYVQHHMTILKYCAKICVHDEHPLAGRDIQYLMASQDVQHHSTILKYNVQHVKQSWIKDPCNLKCNSIPIIENE